MVEHTPIKIFPQKIKTILYRFSNFNGVLMTYLMVCECSSERQIFSLRTAERSSSVGGAFDLGPNDC